MKAFIASLMMVAFLCVPHYSYAQPEAPAAVEEVAEAPAAAPVVAEGEVVMPPSAGEWAKLVGSLGGLKGAGTLAIVAFLVQLLMMLLRTQLGELAGKWRLLAVLGLTMIGGVLGLKMQGMEWIAALMHSTTLAAAQVFAHQAFKQFKKTA